MRQYAETNKPAIFKPVNSGVFKGEYTGSMWIIKQIGGTPYINKGIMERCSRTNPLYGYVKNFTKFKKDFSLFLWTTIDDELRVEAHLDSVVKGLKRNQIVEVLNNIKPMSYVEPSLV